MFVSKYGLMRMQFSFLLKTSQSNNSEWLLVFVVVAAAVGNSVPYTPHSAF